MRRGGRKNEKRGIGIKREVVIIYRVVGMLILLRGTAASNEVVNLSSVFGIIGIRLLGSIL